MDLWGLKSTDFIRPIVTKGDPDQNIPITTEIVLSIFAHREDQYIVSSNPDLEWRCDNYVEAIVEQSGGDVNKLFAGPANQKSVQEHINNAIKNNNILKSKKNNAPNLSNGAYVVFMNESNIISSRTGKPLEPHAGFIVIKGKKIEYSDNSSGNNNNEGGAQTRNFTSVQEFQDSYGYQAFYYQIVEKKE